MKKITLLFSCFERQLLREYHKIIILDTQTNAKTLEIQNCIDKGFIITVLFVFQILYVTLYFHYFCYGIGYGIRGCCDKHVFVEFFVVNLGFRC